ncbi:MAG TPA: tripartite tricarboxylate transporter substrate-binding protein [Burkholderiales bacterium]|nr:tripartite tricarboxylate transporter substrate-binding protein [Burkholderiales bacterium]
MLTLRKLVPALSAAAAGLLTLAPAAQAQTYPSKPITLVVPFAAGGPTDVLARIMADRMGRGMGQTVVVENTTGAAGSIGVGRVAHAAADGYTVSIGHWSTHVVNGAIYQLNYDLLKDLDPVAQIASNPQLVVSNNAVPAKDLKELSAWVKANQDKIAVGTAGVGAASHIGGIYYQNFIGAKLTFIPYRGTGPALQDLIAGQIQLMFDQASNSLPQVRAGKVRGYAVTQKARLGSAPEIPTVDEAGAPGLYMAVWHGLWVPHGTPKAATMKLEAAAQEALADPAVSKRLFEMGQEIPGKEFQTPEGLAKFQKAEIDKWWPLIKAANIKVE